MKILNIHFKNINSLEGENRVNFERAPFSDTGVFAITGPNGSGKSSILDAITLGLYGETFRFPRPAQHVMTKRSAECFSEIEFSLGQDKYRSSWHVRREGGDPEGELLPAEMKLTHLNGVDAVLAETPQEVCARITEITGMNFRNFTRSILLAQGDFAAFLNALDSERMDILEKIISTDIYADFKKEITDKAHDAQIRLEQLEQDLSLIPIMEPEKREASEHDLADFNDQYDALQIELNELKRQQFALQKISALQSQMAGQENDLKEVRSQAAAVAEKLSKIASSRDALPFKDEVAVIEAKNRSIQQDKATLASFQEELKQLENIFTGSGIDQAAPEGLENKSIEEQQQSIGNVRVQINQLDSARYSASMTLQSLAAQISEKKSALATVSEWLDAHTTEASLLTNFPEIAKLKNLRAEIVELSEKQKAFVQTAKYTTSAIKNQKTLLEKEEAKRARLQDQLEMEEKMLEELVQGKQPEDIEALRQEQQERVQSLKELTKLASVNRKLTGQGAGLFGLFKGKDTSIQDPGELALELEKVRQEIKREENIRLILDAAVAREALMRKMMPDRHLLVDGKPCPLCGALEHPYAKKPPVVGSSQQALADQQAKLKTLRVSAEKVEQQLKIAEKQAQSNRSNQLQAQLAASQWLTLANRLNILSDDLDINNTKLLQRILATEENELKNIVFLSAKYRSKLAVIEKLKTSITVSSALIDQLQSRYRKLDSEWVERPEEQVEIETRLAERQTEEPELAAKVNEQLALLGEKMPARNKEDVFLDKLNSRRQDYHGYAIRSKMLSEELEALIAKEAAGRSEINACNEKLDHYKSQLKSEEIVGLHLALIEKQKLIADQQRLIARQEAEAAALQKTLQEKAQGTPFSHYSELSDALELIEIEPQLEQQAAESTQAIATRTTELEKIRLQLETEKAAVDAKLSLDVVNAELHSIAEKLEIANFEIRHLDSLLKEQQQLQHKYNSALTQVREQREITRQCQSETAQLAAENGMEFRRRVQGRIAERLLSQTNAILEKISGRYYIRKMPSEQGLSLEIEDTFQGNVRRLPKTLSGGESFVVSLALALGLSELANNGKSVDSLFLDEGFGNLDAETLYTVISTLEGLRTHGKTVGVISHVESVQKRFKAQLQVVKKPNGMGMLKKTS
jgi:exonuclease SbcC